MKDKTLEKKDRNEKGKHIPVLLEDVLKNLQINETDIVVDCTVNRGGHSKEILSYLSGEGSLICIDLDLSALEEARNNINLELEKLKNSSHKNKELPKVFFVNDNFSNLENILKDLKIEKVDKIFADLGISSQELDISGRGFTFMKDESLNMNFRSEIKDEYLSASEIVNEWSEKSIADILFNFSDERYSRRIAKAIVDSRKIKKINTTFELVELIKRATPYAYHKLKTHPATRSFQALRMAVNDEIGGVVKLINISKNILKDKGRLAIITFHSTEDRIVKHTARDLHFIQVNKKPIIVKREELTDNIRSRSAKLRIYEKTQ